MVGSTDRKAVMTLKQQLMDDMKQAMKSGDKQQLDTIRFVVAKIKNVEIDKGEQNDAQIQQIIGKQIKEMREVFPDYEKAGRSDLLQADQAKIAVLEKYLPAQLTESEIDALIDTVMTANPGAPMGKIIGAVNQQAAGRADGGVVAQKVKARLS